MPGPVIRTDQYKGYPKWLASILAGSELTSLATPLQVGLGHGSIKWVREFLDPTVRRLNNKPGFLKRSLHLAKDPKTPYRIATGTNFDEALAKQLRDLPYDEAIDIIAKRNRADPKYVNPNVIRGDLITDSERIIDVRHPVSTQKVKELSDVFGSQYKSAIDSMRNPRATPKDRLDVFSSLQDADPYGASAAAIEYYDSDPDLFNKYCDAFCEKFDPPYICTDIYPLNWIGGKRATYKDYCESINLIAASAREHDKDFWCCIQTFAWVPSKRTPTEAEFRWQSYCMLSFGCQGLLCWTYARDEPECPSLITVDGKRTNAWYDADGLQGDSQSIRCLRPVQEHRRARPQLHGRYAVPEIQQPGPDLPDDSADSMRRPAAGRLFPECGGPTAARRARLE